MQTKTQLTLTILQLKKISNTHKIKQLIYFKTKKYLTKFNLLKMEIYNKLNFFNISKMNHLQPIFCNKRIIFKVVMK